jgi:L-threonylcarbamoyladenylate synthase
MQTTLTEDPLVAADVIRGGGIVAFPTETVYGLGADLFNTRAVERIFEAKMRPADNPLIAHISRIGQIDDIAAEMSESANLLVAKFFPGPLTVVLKKRIEVPAIATAGLDTIGVRMPHSELAATFLSACRVPVVAPSANISGRPSPTTWRAVLEDLDGRIDCILQGDPTAIGVESTVVDCTVEPPVLLRSGAVSFEDIAAVVPDINEVRRGDVNEKRSPGLLHKHYSPRATVRMVAKSKKIDSKEPFAFIGLESSEETPEYSVLCRTIDEYAMRLYEFFRECDRRGIAVAYCQIVEHTGIGRALMDRISRASEK